MPQISISELQDLLEEEQGEVDERKTLRREKKEKKHAPPPRFPEEN